MFEICWYIHILLINQVGQITREMQTGILHNNEETYAHLGSLDVQSTYTIFIHRVKNTANWTSQNIKWWLVSPFGQYFVFAKCVANLYCISASEWRKCHFIHESGLMWFQSSIPPIRVQFHPSDEPWSKIRFRRIDSGTIPITLPHHSPSNHIWYDTSRHKARITTWWCSKPVAWWVRRGLASTCSSSSL